MYSPVILSSETPPKFNRTLMEGSPFMPTDDRSKGLDLALAQIEKQFGRGAIMRLGAATNLLGVEAISCGSLSLDIALGIGGFPRGRIIEIFGSEASGKTTLALHAAAEAQRAGGTAAFIDAEHALDPAYAKKIGVDIDELLISQPESGEQCLEITDYLVRSGAVDVIIIDSVAALVPKAELEGDMGDTHIGLQARLMSQALRKLTSSISRSRSAVIFINQLREKIGVLFGNPETTPGGRALKFYASVRVDMRRTESIKQDNVIQGTRVRARVIKNKVAPPFRVAEFDIMFSEGISKSGDLIDLGVNLGLIKKSGSFYSYGDLRIGQGREAAKSFVKDHPESAQPLEQEIRSLSAQLTNPKSDKTEQKSESPAPN
jgi:recombination protein RecA